MAGRGAVGIGLIGLGRAGVAMHLGAMKSRSRKFRLVGCCDPVRDRRERISELYGCRAYGTLKELLGDDDVELVDIACRSTEHASYAIESLKTGKDVFLEKPIAVTYKGALKIQQAARRAEGRLYVGHNRRFEPAFQHIREIVCSGVLGDLFDMRLCRTQFQRRNDWQTIRKEGGGQLLNWGPHIVDHALRFLGSPVTEVWSDLKKIAAVGDAEDHLKIVLKAKTGCTATVEISGGTAIGSPEFALWGTKGALECSGGTIRMRYLDPKHKLPPRKLHRGLPPADGGFGGGDELKWVEKTFGVNPHLKVSMDSIWDYLYESIRKGTKFPITMEEAVETMRILSLARKGTVFEPPKGLL